MSLVSVALSIRHYGTNIPSERVREECYADLAPGLELVYIFLSFSYKWGLSGFLNRIHTNLSYVFSAS